MILNILPYSAGHKGWRGEDKAHFLRLHGFEGVDGERGGGDGYATSGGQPRLQVVHQSFAGIVYLFRLLHVLLLNIQHLAFNT